MNHWVEKNEHGGFNVLCSLGAARDHVATFKTEHRAQRYCEAMIAPSQVERTKQALCASMGNAAASSNRMGALKRLADSGLLTEEQFLIVIEQHPITINRDLENARADFQRAKTEYEAHCEAHGLPAYATYNED